MLNITDTHIHLQDFNHDFALELLSLATIKNLILVSANCNDFEKISNLYKTSPQKITPSFGYHPWEALKPYSLELLKTYLTSHPSSLIGEIGLDGIKTPPSLEQHKLFSSQLSLAKILKRPVIIHGAKANPELYKYRLELSSIKYVYHSFPANLELLKFLISTEAYIGLGSSFINSPKAQTLISYLPKDKILFETDAPYQTKQETYLSTCQSNLIILSKLLNISPDNLEQTLSNNFKEFIKC